MPPIPIERVSWGMGAIAFGWLHYTGLRSDLSTARADLVAAQSAAEAAITAAETTAQTLEKVRQDHEHAVSLLADAQSQIDAVISQNRDLEAEILASSSEDDGSVAPVLENLRRVKFGGAR